MEPRSERTVVASFSWSLQARARRLTRSGKASANPRTPSRSPRSTRRLDPPAPAPLDAHSGSRRAISPQRYMSAASLRGGRTGRLRAARGLVGGWAWLLTRESCATREGRSNATPTPRGHVEAMAGCMWSSTCAFLALNPSVVRPGVANLGEFLLDDRDATALTSGLSRSPVAE
jgi:hypothetical protein